MDSFKIAKPFRTADPRYPGYGLYQAKSERCRDIFILSARPLEIGESVAVESLTLIPDTTYLNSPTYELPHNKI